MTLNSNPGAEISDRLVIRQFLEGLREADWNARDGPMRFSRKLVLEDFAHAPFPANVRLLLQALEAEGGTAVTATGNLNRAFVGKLVDRLVMPGINRKTIRHVSKVINETDVWDLHLARIVAQLAKLMQRKAKRFNVTNNGRKLLKEDQAGEFYRTVFITYFRKFDLNYDFYLRPVPEIQITMAAILWRLDAVAKDWVPARDLAPQILLPKVYERLRAAMTHPEFDTEEWILGGHVLQPLIDLGLLERRSGEIRWPVKAEDEIRQTRLWRKFFWFNLQM